MGIEALASLERFGTVSEAAARLRLTQSAVSKRLQALQASVGVPLLEPEGRRVRLTAEAIALLDRARPLLAELRDLATPRAKAGTAHFSLALADSIAASWGPRVVAKALRDARGVGVSLHAHRSVLLIENVRLGRYQLGISTELPAPDLVWHPLVEEPMALVGPARRSAPLARASSTRAPLRSSLERSGDRSAPLITIEPTSATWRAIEPLLRKRHAALLARTIVPVESFSAALQMVKAGFGDGLVPLGLALEAHLDRASYRELGGVARRVSLVARKTALRLAGFEELRDALVRAVEHHFARRL